MSSYLGLGLAYVQIPEANVTITDGHKYTAVLRESYVHDLKRIVNNELNKLLAIQTSYGHTKLLLTIETTKI